MFEPEANSLRVRRTTKAATNLAGWREPGTKPCGNLDCQGCTDCDGTDWKEGSKDNGR